MRITKKYIDAVTYEIIGAAIEVHKELGPGLLENVYEKCFVKEMVLRGLMSRIKLLCRFNLKGLL